jgi:ParB-like chromosome segregation protein Spo0J
MPSAKPEIGIEWWPIDRPQPYERNARKIPDAAVSKVATSIREFGWRQPIVCDPKDVIIIGHVRLLAARKLGLARWPELTRPGKR